jgi:quinone-modifying oxidoreductase subunit QmoB
MTKKLGVYMCKGCGLGDALDMEKLDKKVAVDLIKKDIEGEGVNTVVICACSRRVLQDVFDFGPEVIVERVNLREGVVWSHKPREAAAPAEGEEGPAVDEWIQEMAQDYVRMGLAESERIELPEPFEETIDKKILVMGGGVTGLTAALEVAKTGYEATVIEKGATLGGFAAKIRKQTPTASPYEALQQPMIEQIIKEAEAHPKIPIPRSLFTRRPRWPVFSVPPACMISPSSLQAPKASGISRTLWRQILIAQRHRRNRLMPTKPPLRTQPIFWLRTPMPSVSAL